MRLFLAICFAALLPLAATAQDLPTPLSDTVSDFANVIGPDAEAEIAAELQRHRDETGVHMVAVTLPSQVGGKPGERIEDYATRLFNAWGVGDAARNDGLMILVIPSDRVVRIATGAGYDRVYDGRAQRVIDTTMLPAFRAGDFAAGIRDGVESARLRLIDPFVAGKPVTVDEGFPPERGAWVWIAGAIAAIGGLSIFAGPKIYRYYKTCPQCQQPTLNRRSTVIQEASYSSSGHGIRYLNCPSCGYNAEEPYTISQRRRSSGSSGGGGFGGGRSSGGGATGRW